MNRTEEKPKTIRLCAICGHEVGGVPGDDYEVVVTRRKEEKYYCRKCVEAIKRGE